MSNTAPPLSLETHRVELTAYCYRMLGSGFEAEDAVQETLLRAWRTYDADRGPMRPWLYRIATTICVDMLRSAQRRARPMDLNAPVQPGSSLGAPLPPDRWVNPIHTSLVCDPADTAEQRESIRLAFVAALQHLPPKQRAVLILRDVLVWQASEVAELLDTTVASVNSALQRARTTLAARPLPKTPLGTDQEQLLRRYLDAFTRYDIAALTALLHKDVTSSMPPFQWWLQGRAAVQAVMSAGEHPCRNARLLPTSVNGCAAFGQYFEDGSPFALVVLETSDGWITEVTTHLLAEHLLHFALPAHL